MKWGLPIGISMVFWSLIGLIRFTEERIVDRKKRQEVVLYLDPKAFERKRKKVAACIAARNEEAGILKTINSVKKILPAQNIYIVSDGSTDKTAVIAKKSRCKALVLDTSHGKAGALEKLIAHFDLLNRYDFVMFVDADTRIGIHYLHNALAIFENPKISCIAGYARNQWRKHRPLIWRYFIIAYRARLYSTLQFFLVYGQTWNRLNVTNIIPGFASIYRTVVLRKLELNAPGVIIEDFNLTFQVRKKKLGLIAHHPSVFGIAQDPANIWDYTRQVSRWNLGFFQTVRRYGVWFSLFWVSLGFLTIETFLAAIFFITTPFVLIVTAIYLLQPYYDLWPWQSSDQLYHMLTDGAEIIALALVADYLLTVFIAIKDRRPLLMLYGVGFFLFRYIDAFVLLTTTPKAFFVSSPGRWVSPERR